jgi:hypothetical protein
VSYDIVTNNEPQITDISMMAYYYHDDRFDKKVDCENLNGSGMNNELDDNTEDLEESDSMFDKIFKKINIK